MYSFVCISNPKRIVSRIIYVVLISLLPIAIFSQQAFAFQKAVNSIIKIAKSYSENTQINLISNKPISDLSISCDIVLNSDSSLVRIILVDENHKEYLVCEVYPLLVDSNITTLTDYAEETASLNNIIAHTLRIEINDASVNLREIITHKPGKIAAKIATESSRQQNSDKIKRLNENIKKKGGLWIAGETSVSKLTFEQKRQLFGGIVPNLQGFEYYKGGIFAMPGAIQNKTKEEIRSTASIFDSPYVKEFSWRNRHGKNWVTSVKNQGSLGSCWAFSAIGATELLVNLFYNQHLNLDLSEQELFSCSSLEEEYGYLINHGVMNESCFPYGEKYLSCSEKCNNPIERIKIGGNKSFTSNIEDELKRMIINGPVDGAFHSWAHKMMLVGYKVIEEGDDLSAMIIVPDGNPLIGKTAWLFKNSWGTEWGDSGFIYIVNGINDFFGSGSVYGPAVSMNLNNSDVACNDEDGDGYFTWGIGPKPVHCPECYEEPDGDDSNPCLGPMDEYGYIKFMTQVPKTENIFEIKGDTIPDLKAEGDNITWYNDNERDSMLYKGNSYATGKVDPGKYTYYVTQTQSGCESDIIPVTLTIYDETLPPIAENISIYAGDTVPTLFAIGENIKWYADANNPLYDIRDGQVYKTQVLGDQLWMAENLNYVTPEGSWYYDNDSLSYAETYGRLYNWNTALNSCPQNWKLPGDEDWMKLEMFLGMGLDEIYLEDMRGPGTGGKLKETGNEHWFPPNEGATNEVGFNARAGGGCYNNKDFGGMKAGAGFYTSSSYNSICAYIRSLESYSDKIGRGFSEKPNGKSVRCVSIPLDPIAMRNSYKPDYILPGKYIYYVTQTISGFESSADTVVFTILSEVPPPTANNIAVCEKSQIPDLYAQGKNINWYSDAALTNLIHSGNSYTTGKTLPGTYSYHVTQTIGNSESKADTVILTISPVPQAPVALNTSVCENQPVPELTAVGENIRWYIDSMLTNLIYAGRSFSPGQKESGRYIFYLTQTIEGCESEYIAADLYINPLPAINLANDTTIYRNQDIILGPFENENHYLWNDGSVNPYLKISGNKIGLGDHTISVKVTDTTTCMYSDTIIVNVVNCTVAGTLNAEVCEIFISPSGKYTWMHSGTYLDTIPNAQGCDSIIMVNLTIKYSTTSTITSTICDKYTSPSGKVWTVSGDYTDTIPNNHGCDSIITVHLTILAANTSVTQNQSVLTANATGATYQWIDCGNGNTPVEGETQQTYAAGKGGNYAVIVSENECTDTSVCFSVSIASPLINTFKHNVTLYPNPTDGSFSIDLGSTYPKAEITITQLDGRIIRQDYIINNRFKDFRISELPGIYMVIITTENESAMFKILKK